MRISYNWLKDYVDIRLSPEKLAETLTMAGLPVESVERKGDDAILELEVTSNRPDCLSYIGVAREVSALTGRKLKIRSPGHQVTRSQVKKQTDNRKPQTKITIKVIDAALCPRYTARVIRNVKVGESPAWLKARLESMGLRGVNNIVDITNLCLFETGEPMHAFDLDKITGSEVIIRRARKGEKIITIDGIERTLDESALLIADAKRPIAIAGVMGGLDTEVTPSTKNILLEAAYFDPVSIRRTSRKLGISTESSYRFERRVDMDNIVRSSERATNFILDVAAGKDTSAAESLDAGKKDYKKGIVELRYSRLTKILGAEITAGEAKRILTALGLKPKSSSSDKARFEIPSFRYDLKSEIDLIEEVARVYGYGRIPSTIPGIVEQPIRGTILMKVSDRMRRVLVSLGFEEIITYSLLSKRISQAVTSSAARVVEIVNPISAEQEILRESLLAGMLNAILWNINRKAKDFKLFEVGNVYAKEQDNSFSEETALSIGMTGQAAQGWATGERPYNFFDIKGALEALLSEFGMKDYRFIEADEPGLFGVAAKIEIDNKEAGVLGEVAHSVLNAFDIKNKVFYLEIKIAPFLKYAGVINRYTELPKYPAVSRDISIILDKGVKNSDIVSAIKGASGEILKKIELIDRYEGKQIPEGKIGLTYSLEYQNRSKTLEEKDVSEIYSKILSILESSFGAKLR